MKTVSENPFRDFRNECENALRTALKKTFPKVQITYFSLSPSPFSEFGDLASPLCFDLLKHLGKTPLSLAEEIVNRIDLSKVQFIESVKVAGGGYINFYADYPYFSHLTLDSARELNSSYGYVKAKHPIKVVVEHTSVNPAGPIHIGTARNSVIGDSIARLLRERGHEVSTHFYIDDVGRQVAFVVYGREMIAGNEPKGKPDHWIGFIYAATSCIVAIKALKEKIEELKDRIEQDEDLQKAQKELNDWVLAANDLRVKDSELFDRLSKSIDQDTNPETNIGRITYLYEKGDPKVRKAVRSSVEICLSGFKDTYNRVGIHWNQWDWESELVWSGAVSEAIKRLKETTYVLESDGVLSVDVERVANEKGLKKLFGISEDLELPPLILMRSDGTTLYTTRDIAYSLWKFKHAQSVINVIGTEQNLAQIQLRIAVSLLTSPARAKDLIHFPHALVDLPNYKMSKRRGRYVTFDEIIEESTKRAFEEVERRSQQLTINVKRRIAEAVGIGAIKYALVSVAPLKRVIFSWDKVLNFEINSAPFIQYAHARACSILKKAEVIEGKLDYSLLVDPLEHSLVRKIAELPEIFANAADQLQPNMIAEFANDLAAKFNSFYASLPVLQAGSRDVRDVRLALVDATRITLRNALKILGIEALERM